MHQQLGKRLEDHKGQPYQDPVLNRYYNQLFCDDIEAFRTSVTESTPPWSVLLSSGKTQADLEAIVEDGMLESRAKIFAHRTLKRADAHLYGAILEVSLDKTLNVLAAYRDGSARAINNGRIIDWENREDAEVTEAIVTFLSASQFAAVHLTPWNKPRLPFPNPGITRFSILTSDDFFFGQGNMDKLMKDPLGEPVLQAGMDLLMKLSMKAS
jgi:hypothetical protein